MIYQYDQRLRLKAINRALHKAGLDLDGNSRILDIGCGTGDLISMLTESRDCSAVGVDLSDAIVDFARKRFASNPKISIDAASATELPASPLSFDLIACVNVLQHITDEEDFARALDRICLAVRPGGHILLMEFSPVKVGVRLPNPYLVIRSRSAYIRAFEERGSSLSYECGLPRVGVRASRIIVPMANPVRWLRMSRTRRSYIHGLPGNSGQPGTVKQIISQFLYWLVLTTTYPIDSMIGRFPKDWTDMRLMIFYKKQDATPAPED
jgi:ubiquinone/menaquinone biosynthesis C-methylase UbiE